jgi:hypothetical protein
MARIRNRGARVEDLPRQGNRGGIEKEAGGSGLHYSSVIDNGKAKHESALMPISAKYWKTQLKVRIPIRANKSELP